MQQMIEETVKNSSSNSNSMQLTIPAELQYLENLGAALRKFLETVPDLAEPEVTLYNLELAVQEIAVNIVNHAYANSTGEIEFSAILSHPPLCIHITMQDQGCKFDPNSVSEPQLGELQEHGFGLFLVHHLMDTVEYQNVNGKNIWQMSKRLPLLEK